jgi:dTDP-4-dehydrorhamnose reductase
LGIVLVTGAGGLLGREVARALRGRSCEVVALTRSDLDVAHAQAVHDTIEGVRPSAVVHCAAMTDVDGCETDPGRAWAVNAEGSRIVAAAAARAGAEILAVSTDYVFDGQKGSPYTEGDVTHPVQEYGRSKLGGERFVLEENARHYIVRSAWIYGVGGKNFLSRLYGLVRDQGRITAVVDQTSSPTYARDLAEAITDLLASSAYGLYHVTNEGACTFAAFCRHALGVAGIPAHIEEVSWRDLGRAAPRPANTSLDNAAWRAAGFPGLRPWTEAAKAFCREAT